MIGRTVRYTMKTPTKYNRLKLAKDWVKLYPGKNIVKGYAKNFGVDKLCAIKELRLSGIEISEEYENQIRQSIEEIKRQKKLRKEKGEQELKSLTDFDSDENFAFIAGYTSGGFPYGITHEEMDEINSNTEF
jgi:hypothetical protein